MYQILYSHMSVLPWIASPWEVKCSSLSPTLWDLMDCSPPGSSVCGIFQTRILEWVAIPFSRGSSQSRNWTQVFYIAGRFFTFWATREALSLGACSESEKWKWNSVVSGSLRPPMDCGILQARILEWIVFPFSRVSSQPRDKTQVLNESYSEHSSFYLIITFHFGSRLFFLLSYILVILNWLGDLCISKHSKLVLKGFVG